MRKLILLALLAIPLMGGAALAASDSGTVYSVDTRTGMLRLTDGASYYVSDRARLSTLRKGDIVRIDYEPRKGGPVAGDIVKTGRTENVRTVISPTRGGGVQNNFTANSDMCKATAGNPNPCHLGAQ